METQLQVVNPTELMRQATDVAGVSREIVLKTAIQIQSKKYVRVEGWQAIAVAHGCVLSAKNVTKTEDGISAIGEVKRISDGTVIATAEGFVGNDEPTWAGRPEYARRAMAQTRAMSRAARSAFAHVVVMIDSNLSTTPAEEVPDDGFQKPQVPIRDGIAIVIHDGEALEKGHPYWEMVKENKNAFPGFRHVKADDGKWYARKSA